MTAGDDTGRPPTGGDVDAAEIAGRVPDRSLTVTGSPLPRPAARAIATARSGSESSAAPAPVLHTWHRQPMLRSIVRAGGRDPLGGGLHHVGV